MNDFTKEELIKLQDCVNHQCYTQPFGSLELAILCEKIQSMIDNYCEHELYCTGCDSEQKHIHCCRCKKSMKQVTL